MKNETVVKPSGVKKSVARSVGLTLASLSFVLICSLAAIPSSATASTFDFVGRWMNFDHDSSGITGMMITPSRNGLSIRVFGLCRGEPVCDWDVAQGNLYSSAGRNMWAQNWGEEDWGGFSWGGGNWGRDTSFVTASFDTGYARKFVVLQRVGRDELKVQVFTDSRDRYGRQGYVTETRLQRWGRASGFGGNQRGPDRDYPQGGPDQR